MRANRRTRSSRNSRTPPRSRHHATRYQCAPPPTNPIGSTERDDSRPLRSSYSIVTTDRLHNASSASRSTSTGPADPTEAGSTRHTRPAIDRVAARSCGAMTVTSLCSTDRAASANGVPAIALNATAVAIASRGVMFSGGNVYARSST